MARVLLSDTDEWELVDDDQDLRGWEVRDARGTPVGEVGDMIVDTDTRRVETIVLKDGATFRAADVHLAEGVVYVDSYGAPAGARPYADGGDVRRRDVVMSPEAAPPAVAPVPPPAPPPAPVAAPAADTSRAERRAATRAYDDYERDFRGHYRDTYSDRDLDYTDYAPAYRFGYDMAYDERYEDRDFDAAEPELREAYYRRHGYPMSDNLVWHSVRDAVRHAYAHARGVR